MAKNLTWGGAFSESFKKLFSANFPSFLIIFSIFTAVNLGITYLLTAIGLDYISFESTGEIVLMVGLFLLVWLLSLAASMWLQIAIAKNSSQTLHKKKADLMETLRYSVSHFWKGVVIALRVFWYVYKWPLLVFAISAFVGVILFLGSNPGDVNSQVISGSFSPQLNAFFAAGFLGMSIFLTAMVVFIVFTIIRGTRAIFAIYAMIEDKAYSKKALEKSMKTVEGNFGKVFWSLFFAGILMGLIFSIPAGMLANPFYDPNIITLFLSQLIASMSAATMALFINQLYLDLKK